MALCARVGPGSSSDLLASPVKVVDPSCKQEAPMRLLPTTMESMLPCKIPGYRNCEMDTVLVSKDEPWKVGGLDYIADVSTSRCPGTGLSLRRYKRRVMVSIVVRKYKKANIQISEELRALILDVWDDKTCDLMSKRTWEWRIFGARQALPLPEAPRAI